MPTAGDATNEEVRLCDALARVALRVDFWASRGTPAGMVAVYVRVEVAHAIAGHEGEAQECTPCYESLRAMARPSRRE